MPATLRARCFGACCISGRFGTLAVATYKASTTSQSHTLWSFSASTQVASHPQPLLDNRIPYSHAQTTHQLASHGTEDDTYTPEDTDVHAIPKECLSFVEADSFWCLSKLLDGIQVLLERRSLCLIVFIQPIILWHFTYDFAQLWYCRTTSRLRSQAFKTKCVLFETYPPESMVMLDIRSNALFQHLLVIRSV